MKQLTLIPKLICYAMILNLALILVTFPSCKKTDNSAIKLPAETASTTPKNKLGVESVPTMTIVSNTMISSRAAWNGLTDLQGYKGLLYCVYREASGHMATDGKIRVLRYNTSTYQWDGICLLAYAPASGTIGDLRDPHLSIRPSDGKMMLNVGVHLYRSSDGADLGIEPLAYFSADMVNWGTPSVLGPPKSGWLWRTEWYNSQPYSFKYGGGEHLMTGTDGTSFPTQLGPTYYSESNYFPNETGFVFGDNSMVAIMRMDGADDKMARVGFSNPPFTSIGWYISNVRVGGPNLYRLENGAIIAGIRHVIGDQAASTNGYPAIVLVETGTGNRGQLPELLRLAPNSDDEGYVGLWKYGSQLWASYYSSHVTSENPTGKPCIYLAKINYTL